MPLGVIMAGGAGERFWPLTDKDLPKYCIRLDGKYSLLQKTFSRLRKIYPAKHLFVITTADHVRFIRKELPAIPKTNILVEPERRNTAPALYLSVCLLEKRFGREEVVSFYPADHLIEDEKQFIRTVRGAIDLAASQDTLVTIGIKPSFPAIGYGYIEAGAKIKDVRDAHRVRRFAEKPKLALAQKYLKTGRFFWNAGMFTWRAGVFLDAMKKASPQIALTLDLDAVKKSYRRLPKISIDYALMEKAKNLSLLKTRMDWCDMGSWDMFFSKQTKDPDHSAAQGNARMAQSKKVFLFNSTDRPLVAFGVSGITAVQTPQGTLLFSSGRSEEAALFGKRG